MKKYNSFSSDRVKVQTQDHNWTANNTKQTEKGESFL